MFYLVSYDIPDDKRRTRLAKAVKDFGDRVQYSVFECLLDDTLFEQMTDRITSIIDMNEMMTECYGSFKNGDYSFWLWEGLLTRLIQGVLLETLTRQGTFRPAFDEASDLIKNV